MLYNSFTTYPYHLTLDREKGFQIAVFSIQQIREIAATLQGGQVNHGII